MEDYSSRRHRIASGAGLHHPRQISVKKSMDKKEEAAARRARVAKLRKSQAMVLPGPTTTHIRMGTPLAARSSVTNAFAQGMFPVLATSKMNHSPDPLAMGMNQPDGAARYGPITLETRRFSVL